MTSLTFDEKTQREIDEAHGPHMSQRLSFGGYAPSVIFNGNPLGDVGVGGVVFRKDFPVEYPHLPPPAPGTRRVVDRGVVLDRRGGQWYGLPVKWEDIMPTRIAFAIRMLPWKR